MEFDKLIIKTMLKGCSSALTVDELNLNRALTAY